MRSRRKTNFVILTVWILCAWYLLDMSFSRSDDSSYEEAGVDLPWRYEAKEHEQRQDIFEPNAAGGEESEETLSSLEEGATSSSTEELDISTTELFYTTVILTQRPLVPSKVPSSASPIVVDSTSDSFRALATTETPTLASPTSSSQDRIVVIAKLPTDNTSWVSTDLPDWKAAIYAIDTDHPHNRSTLDPLTNTTLRTLKNKGMEANAYLAYIIQNYDILPSTMAFIHPHKDGYPEAWHTDNPEYSNVVSLQTLNIDFVQRNGYANLRCALDPGCPHEVMPFRDPPEKHRTIEAAMPEAWRDLFNNSNVPPILATPCCAQFAVSRDQVRKKPLEEYQKYYQWLMDTPLKDETSGRVFEYLWHIIFGQDPIYCPEIQKCYCDVYNKC